MSHATSFPPLPQLPDANDHACDAASLGAAPIAFASVYQEFAPFVWRSLRRLGVAAKDVEDAAQEVFVVIHKKLEQFQGGAIRAWCFAICLRVASDYRKKAHVRREVLSDSPPEPSVSPTQAAAVDQRQARELLDKLLDGLDDAKRAVFVLYELEQMPMSEIAEACECPLQTAYSRLHAARQAMLKAADQLAKGADNE